MLEKQSKIVKLNPDAATLYLIIPADLVKDSAFPFKEGEFVKVRIDAVNSRLIVEPILIKKEG